jgi:hypothetical protein
LRKIKRLEPDLISRVLCVCFMSTPCQRLTSRTPRKDVIIDNQLLSVTAGDSRAY